MEAFPHAWWDHMLTGSCAGVVILVLSAAVSWATGVPASLGPALAATAVAVLLAETLSAAFDHWYNRRVGRPDPGGWVPTVEIPVKYCTIYPVVTALSAGTGAGAVVLAASITVTVLDLSSR